MSDHSGTNPEDLRAEVEDELDALVTEAAEEERDRISERTAEEERDPD